MDVVQALVHERAIEPGTRLTIIYGFMGAFAPLSLVIISLRMYSRWRFTHIGLDDVFALVGFALYVGLIVATVFATQYGLGHHIWTISEEAGELMQKCGFTSQVLYPPALGAVKLSIVLFFIRCLPVVHGHKNALYWFTGFIAVEELAFTIALFVQCRPLSFYWDKTIEGGTCINQPAFYYADAAVNLATDLCILSLPWILFRKLNVSRQHKYIVVGICSLSVFTLISSIVRLPYLHNLNQSKDPTWSVVDICIWSVAELGSAISLSSIPSIRPLYAHVFLKGRHSDPGASSGGAKKQKKTGGMNLPFSVATLGSKADKSAWKPKIQLYSLKSQGLEEPAEHNMQVTESQDRIVALKGGKAAATRSVQGSSRTSADSKGAIEVIMVSEPEPAAVKSKALNWDALDDRN